MKLFTALAALTLIAAPAQAFTLNPETKTSAQLQAEGKTCNVFQRSPITWFDHVKGKRFARVGLMGVWGNQFQKYENGDYSANSYKTDCTETQVKLSCMKGDCWMSMNSQDHGYHPGKQNVVLIDGKRFSWVGEMPTSTGRQMWKTLREGSVVKSSLVLWPSRYTNHKDVLRGVQQSKNTAYKLSLKGE